MQVQDALASGCARGRMGAVRFVQRFGSTLNAHVHCARPPVALERLEQLGEDALIYRFGQPQPDRRTQLRLTPLQLIERLAALIPPPRLHRHRYHRVLD